MKYRPGGLFQGDFFLEEDQSFQDRLRPGRATGDINVNR